MAWNAVFRIVYSVVLRTGLLCVVFLQKLEVVNEYLMTVDTAADNGGDVANLVREVTEEAERRSEYRSCGSNTPKLSSSSSSSSSLSASSSDDDSYDQDDEMFGF